MRGADCGRTGTPAGTQKGDREKDRREKSRAKKDQEEKDQEEKDQQESRFSNRDQGRPGLDRPMRHMLLNPGEAAQSLRAGKVIAYPTEAVFGLGCDPLNEEAVNRILSLKHRSVTQGLILIGGSFEQFESWISDVSPEQRQMAQNTWPGPVTWLFPKSEKVPKFVSGDHDTIAIRVTAHAPCIELCNAFGGPLVSTSANPHSTPPARSAGEVENYFGSFLGGILEGPLGGFRNPSEIRDLQTGVAIREG
jgi:L-threonylcarbamoyladenylate synthase